MNILRVFEFFLRIFEFFSPKIFSIFQDEKVTSSSSSSKPSEASLLAQELAQSHSENRMVRSLHRVLFKNEVPLHNQLFAKGRMAYVVELEDEETDIPTTLLRCWSSKIWSFYTRFLKKKPENREILSCGIRWNYIIRARNSLKKRWNLQILPESWRKIYFSGILYYFHGKLEKSMNKQWKLLILPEILKKKKI